jgi:adenylate kinase
MSANLRATSLGLALGIAAAALVMLPAGDARAQSARVKAACSGDYGRFCPSYPVGSAQLRQCMRANGKSLSRDCIDALVDDGEIKRSEVKSKRR